MNWTEIWANYLMPAVASVGGFGMILGTLFTIIKGRVNIMSVAKKSADNTLDGVKTNIQVSINDIVEEKLRPVVNAALEVAEQMKEPIKAIANEQAEIRNAILAIGEYQLDDLSHGQDAKKRLRKAMDAVRQSGNIADGKVTQITKVVPKTATATLNKASETKQTPQSEVMR